MIDEKEIRTALEIKAREVAVPAELSARTLEAAGNARPAIRDRVRDWRRGRRTGARVRGFPRWMYAPAAAALVILLFGIGTAVTASRQPRVAATKAPVEPVGGTSHG